MTELSLTTRHRQGSFEADARLIVVDSLSIASTTIADEVRDLLQRRPLTKNIYVAAPFLAAEDLEQLLTDGLGVVRADAGLADDDLRFWMLDLRQDGGHLRLMAQDFASDGLTVKAGGQWSEVSDELVQGWLFDMFDTSRALVSAPAGVHFTKSSGKHSTKFLRTSSALLTTAACGILGMAALSRVRFLQPRRVFVDTAPLLSVTYAMAQVANVRQYWEGVPPAKSFSSYGGKDSLPKLGAGDLVLVSASTSGGLARELLSRGVHEDMLLTLFYLASETGQISQGTIVCDLTARPERTFGYQRVESHAPGDCPLCKAGYVRAELEGDQFLIDRRAVKRLRLLRSTQPNEARTFFEKTTRCSAWRVRLYEESEGRPRVEVDRDSILGENKVLDESFSRLLGRFIPQPLHLVVCVGLDSTMLKQICTRYDLEKLVEGATFVEHGGLRQAKAIDPGRRNALVVFGVLEDHSQARTINAALRDICRGGNVAYLGALSVAETARAAEDLRVFLSYGERGSDTFTYRVVSQQLLPYNSADAGPWTKEQDLLQRLAADGGVPEELATRLHWLQEAGREHEKLFLTGFRGRELQISPDFVFLDTTAAPEAVSQADIFAVVSNVLACARAGTENSAPAKPPARGAAVPTWRQTSLFQTLLCPSNFKDFNDAILRAALLRAADDQELNYALDDFASAEMLDLLLGQLGAWESGSADALPEFLLALATKRMRLARGHMMQLVSALAATNLPEYMKRLAAGLDE